MAINVTEDLEKQIGLLTNLVKLLVGIGFAAGVWATTLEYRIRAVEHAQVQAYELATASQKDRESAGARLERIEARVEFMAEGIKEIKEALKK